MRIRIVVAIILLAVGLCLVSTWSYGSGGEQAFDGYWWNSLSREVKGGFVRGYHTATEEVYRSLWIGEAVEYYREKDPDEILLSEGALRWITAMYEYYEEHECLVGFTYGQIVDGIDEFYADFRNRIVDIADTIMIVAMQLNNRPEEEVSRNTKLVRQKARDRNNSGGG